MLLKSLQEFNGMLACVISGLPTCPFDSFQGEQIVECLSPLSHSSQRSPSIRFWWPHGYSSPGHSVEHSF